VSDARTEGSLRSLEKPARKLQPRVATDS
jgi:hypothetical protein